MIEVGGEEEGLGSKVPNLVQGGIRATVRNKLVRLSLTEQFQWNDSLASKQESFWPFFCFPSDMIFNEVIGTFISATLATL